MYSLMLNSVQRIAERAQKLVNNSDILICIAEIHLCVLQTAVGSLQSPDCDTAWIICINVGTGVVLRRKGIIRI